MGDLPVSSAEAMTYSYQNNNNQLTQAINGTNTTFAYNAAGNLITEQKNTVTRTYTYNDHQRLTSVTENSTTLGEYTYNALGRRTKKVAGGNTTLYIYDQNGLLISEYDGSGTWQKDYLYLNGQPLTMTVAGTPENVYYYHNDHLGTPQIMTDSTGAVVWSATYEPFGDATIAPTSTIINNLRFPGQYFDVETGLCYNWNRYYDPKMGKYMESDPIGLRGGINLYVYVKDNPIMHIDSKGLTPKIIGVGIGAEGHAVIGGGRDTFWCCDGTNIWKVRTIKLCFGGGLGYSGGFTVQVVATGVNPKDKCPGGYSGFAPEFGYGPVEYGAGLPESDTGVLHSGGFGRGVGGKATLCYYWITDQQIVGCCGK